MNSEMQNFEKALIAGTTSMEKLLELAKASDRVFVRSLDQLGEDDPLATGRRLTAYEALEAYGKDVIRETLSEGSALLCHSASAAGNVLKLRREQLNLPKKLVASRTRLIEQAVSDAEKSKRLPIRLYEQIARVLALDERYISVRGDAVGRESLAVRLRRIGKEHPRKMTASVVATLAEAAWVAATQLRLAKQLGLTRSFRDDFDLKPSSNYGDHAYPAFRHGYYLAQETRKRLRLGSTKPILSLRELCEDKLGIPLIQAELGERLAGATLRVDDSCRAIIINIGGKSRDNVFMRRSTIAHELGHLIYDEDQHLDELRADEFDDLEVSVDKMTDFVEQRANAFAVELIAPQESLLTIYRQNPESALNSIVSTYGVSCTAARYHLWNALNRSVPLDSLMIQNGGPDRDLSWQGREEYSASYNPLRNIPLVRSGKFCAVVLRAAEENLISWSTAVEYLQCNDEETLRGSADGIRDLFPRVFSAKRLPTGPR